MFTIASGDPFTGITLYGLRNLLAAMLAMLVTIANPSWATNECGTGETIATPATLLTEIQNAPDGGVIYLNDGNYGEVDTSSLANARDWAKRPLFIRPLPGATYTLNGFRVHGIPMLVLDGLAFVDQGNLTPGKKMVEFFCEEQSSQGHCRGAGVINSTMTGDGFATKAGVSCRGDGGIIIFNNTIDNFEYGVTVMLGADACLVVMNDIRRVAHDHIRYEGHGHVFALNYLHTPINEGPGTQHRDLLQGWTRDPQTSQPNVGWNWSTVVVGNILDGVTNTTEWVGAATPWPQGMGLFNGEFNGSFIAWNDVLVHSQFGISLYGGHLNKLHFNTVHDIPGVFTNQSLGLFDYSGTHPTGGQVWGNELVGNTSPVLQDNSTQYDPINRYSDPGGP